MAWFFPIACKLTKTCYNLAVDFCRTEADSMTVTTRPTPAKPQRAARPKTSRVRGVRLLGPKNRQALNLLTAWMSAPDNQGTDWWADFERELADTRLTIRPE
jgi:hypothetical protein